MTGSPVRSAWRLPSGQRRLVWRLDPDSGADPPATVVLRRSLARDAGGLAGEARAHQHRGGHGIGCPLVLRGSRGGPVHLLRLEPGDADPALLPAFLPATHPWRAGERWRGGVLLARLRAVDPPDGMRRPGLVGHAALAEPCLPDGPRRAVDGWLLTILQAAGRWAGPVTVGLCHGDPAPGSILIDGSSTQTLDPERVQVAWTSSDLDLVRPGHRPGRCLAWRGADPWVAAGALLAGYHSIQPPSPAEVEPLPALAAVVVGCTRPAGAAWHRQASRGHRPWQDCLAQVGRWHGRFLDSTGRQPLGAGRQRGSDEHAHR